MASPSMIAAFEFVERPPTDLCRMKAMKVPPPEMRPCRRGPEAWSSTAATDGRA
jgi:hypothetical protein